ncbi:L-amino acid N-acyltransferase YncA [Bradyrhizobium sp. USDA 4532]|nr:L-amino acid N-acyltransferase YncA [Bradyrhizobium sp. USDA 4545]MCP1920244.1 L-amino acid N-acyltransferase YncA [Bradyrhizobium sp. USDA 4532]
MSDWSAFVYVCAPSAFRGMRLGSTEARSCLQFWFYSSLAFGKPVAPRVRRRAGLCSTSRTDHSRICPHKLPPLVACRELRRPAMRQLLRDEIGGRLMSYQVHRLQTGDLPTVTAIYNAACRARESTHGMRPWSVEEMEGFLFGSAPSLESYVCVDHGSVVGWTAFTPYRVREDVRHTVEMSTHVQESVRRRGIGSALARTLLDRSRNLDLHCILTMTFKDRPEVLSFVKKCGFLGAGCLPEVFSEGGKHYDILVFEKLIVA